MQRVQAHQDILKNNSGDMMLTRGEAHPFRSGCYAQHSDEGSFLKACLTKVKEWIGEPFRKCLVRQNVLLVEPQDILMKTSQPKT